MLLTRYEGEALSQFKKKFLKIVNYGLLKFRL